MRPVIVISLDTGGGFPTLARRYCADLCGAGDVDIWQVGADDAPEADALWPDWPMMVPGGLVADRLVERLIVMPPPHCLGILVWCPDPLVLRHPAGMSWGKPWRAVRPTPQPAAPGGAPAWTPVGAGGRPVPDSGPGSPDRRSPGCHPAPPGPGRGAADQVDTDDDAPPPGACASDPTKSPWRRGVMASPLPPGRCRGGSCPSRPRREPFGAAVQGF